MIRAQKVGESEGEGGRAGERGREGERERERARERGGPLPFDCSAGYGNWMVEWSAPKKVWCCQHAGRGCHI